MRFKVSGLVPIQSHLRLKFFPFATSIHHRSFGTKGLVVATELLNQIKEMTFEINLFLALNFLSI